MNANHSKIKKRIHRMFSTHGADMVREARELYSKHGRGYFNICLKDNDAFKAGQVLYITESDNKRQETKMESSTENDVRLAKFLADYKPQNEVVVMVWHGRLNYVDKLTDTLAPLFATLDGAVYH